VPKSEIRLKEWQSILGINLKKQFRVCASHFNKSDIIDTWESGQGFSKYTVSTYNIQYTLINFSYLYCLIATNCVYAMLFYIVIGNNN